MAYKAPKPYDPNNPYGATTQDEDYPIGGPEGPVEPNPTDPNAPVPPAPPPPEPPAPPTDTYQPPKYQPYDPDSSRIPEDPTYTPEQLAAFLAQKNAMYPDTTPWDTGGYARPGYTVTSNVGAPSGYDPAKWTNPAHQTPKYVVSRILSNYNLGDPAQLQAAIADIQKAYPGTTWGGRDTINVPGIGEVDIIGDFGGANTLAWQPASAAQPGAGAMVPGGIDPLTGLSTGTGTSSSWFQQGMTPYTAPAAPGGTSGLSGSNALDEARRAALLELLNRKPPTAEELRNSPENQAYQLQSQRAEERQRAELAERAAYEGFGNTGFFDTELQGIRQQRAEGEAGFMGELAISRMQAQREDLQFAISEAQQAGQFDLAQQLQREQMTLDAAIRREQMSSTERMAANDLALREFLGKAGINLDQMRLGEDQRQFNYDLGFRGSQLDEQKRQFDMNWWG